MAIVPSPLNRRRLGVFRVNRRERLTLRLFLAPFVVCLLTELIANNRPSLLEYRGRWFLSVLRDYPETALSGELPFPLDYCGCLMSEYIARGGRALRSLIHFDARSINYAHLALAPPSTENWLGTDDQGRDVLARVIYGLRLPIPLVLGLTLVSSLLGICAGAAQGYHGGWIDLSGQRFIEVWSGLPILYLPTILANLVQSGVGWLLATMLLFSWISLVDVVRTEFLCGHHSEYVRAVRTPGLGDAGVTLRHILLNAMVATLTFLPFLLCGAVITLIASDFLGFDLPSGSPSLGKLVGQGRDNLQAPWLGLIVFMVLATLLSLLVSIGEAVRDAFDPRKRDEPGTVASGKPERRLWRYAGREGDQPQLARRRDLGPGR